MPNNYITDKLDNCPQNYFAKYLLDKWRGKEEELCRGFQLKNTSHKPEYRLPEWFNKAKERYGITDKWLYNFFEMYQEPVLSLWLNNGFFVNGNEWFEDLWIKWSRQIASVFILSGNINDYAFNLEKGYMSTVAFVTDEFLNRDEKNKTECIITYSLSRPFEAFGKNDLITDNNKKEIEKHLDERNGTPEMFNKVILDFQFLNT